MSPPPASVPAMSSSSTAATPPGLRFVRGDATSPQAAGPKVIAHVCNDRGGWGKGFELLPFEWLGVFTTGRE